MPTKLLTPLLLIWLATCATATSAERQELIAAPVDCLATESSIETLANARPSTSERARSLLQSLTPIGLVAGMVSGEADDRARVALGSTNREIDQKIQAIKEFCRPEAEGGPSTTPKIVK